MSVGAEAKVTFTTQPRQYETTNNKNTYRQVRKWKLEKCYSIKKGSKY